MSLLLIGEGCEWGWLVACYIPAVRRYSRDYEKVVVACAPGHEYLYEDFADEFVECEQKGNSDRWLLKGRNPHLPSKIRNAYPTAQIVSPREKNCTKWVREYFKYGQEDTDERYDIIFHARAMTKYHQSHLNYPVERYVKVIRELGIDPGMCASIGHPKGASHVPRTKDLRGVNLERVCRVLAHSKVCVGTSSGPMHLASLCCCPHVVITGNEYQKSIKATNRKRYEKLWNPFKTECTVLDKHKWQPPVHKIVKAAGKYL